MIPKLEPVLDSIWFVSGNDRYKKQTEDAYAELFITDDGRLTIESEDGKIIYIIHRPDGPAIESSKSNRTVYVYNGRYHRPDGPAIIQGEIQDCCAYQDYYLFGLMLAKSQFEKYQDFIRRAHDYIVKHNLALEEFDDLHTDEEIVHSFESIDAFLASAEKNQLVISVGMRDVRQTKIVKLDQVGSRVGLGMAGLAFLGGVGLLANRFKRTQQKVKQVEQHAVRVK